MKLEIVREWIASGIEAVEEEFALDEISTLVDMAYVGSPELKSQ